MKVICEDFSVCVDCIMAIANGETPEDAETAAAVRHGIENAGGEIVCGSGESYFSWRACDCCGSRLGGDRLDCTLLEGDNVKV